jgi:hypothetical protein
MNKLCCVICLQRALPEAITLTAGRNDKSLYIQYQVLIMLVMKMNFHNNPSYMSHIHHELFHQFFYLLEMIMKIHTLREKFSLHGVRRTSAG